MDDFSILGDVWQFYLTLYGHTKNLCWEWVVLKREKFHFFWCEELVMGHAILERFVEVDKAKI